MPLTSDQSLVVRQQIAACLGDDISQVVSNANFFRDLGGTMDHLRPLRLAIENALGVSIEPIVTDINSMTEVDGKGNLTCGSLARIRSYLPEILVPFDSASFPSIFSVAMIEAMTAKALEERASAPASATLSTEQSARLRELIALRARVPANQLKPETGLFRDLGMGGASLGILSGMLKGEFDVDVLGTLEKIEARFQVDSQGNVTPESRKQLEPLLSGIDYEAAKATSSTDLLTVGFLESLLARLLAQRPADLPFERITSYRQQEWVRKLPEELGERKLRLLLAGACRLAFRDMPNIEPEVFLALETLERYADTGKTKAALREFQKAYWEWREGRVQQYFALYQALTPNNPEQAVVAVTYAIQAGLRIRDLEALRELQRLHRDLISPLASPDEFVAGWRTPAVVDLAKSMYDARKLDELPRLADLLVQAGCSHPAVLEHCRDPKARHIRGCWVIDAVLDGSWGSEPKAVTRKAAKSKTSAATTSPDSKKPLLSQIPKRAQIEITKVMSEERSQVPVDKYLRTYFGTTLEEMIRVCDSFVPGRGAKELDSQLFELEMKRPELSAEQRLNVVALRWLNLHLDVAVARRVTHEDPAELARGLYVTNRLNWLNWGCQSQDCDSLLNLFAVRDFALVRHLAAHTTYSNTQYPNDEHVLCSYATSALIKRDFESLRPITARMKKKKVRSWMEGKFACLLGIADAQPDQIAHGLRAMLESYQRRRDEDSQWTFLVFNVEVHGLYRLGEWISPDLVAGFDVTQSFPWDAEFHAWTQAHDNPLHGVDLTPAAPILYDAVVNLKCPDWWIQSPEAAQRREQELCAKCDFWLIDFGENQAAVKDFVSRFFNKKVTDCPVQLMAGMMRYMAEGWKRQLQQLGAVAEIRA